MIQEQKIEHSSNIYFWNELESTNPRDLFSKLHFTINWEKTYQISLCLGILYYLKLCQPLGAYALKEIGTKIIEQDKTIFQKAKENIYNFFYRNENNQEKLNIGRTFFVGAAITSGIVITYLILTPQDRRLLFRPPLNKITPPVFGPWLPKLEEIPIIFPGTELDPKNYQLIPFHIIEENNPRFIAFVSLLTAAKEEFHTELTAEIIDSFLKNNSF